MEDAKGYLTSTAPAVEGLFKLMNQYGWGKMRVIVELTECKSRAELKKAKAAFSSKDVARDVISGSILQIAYAAIDVYAPSIQKPQKVLEFEAEINKMLTSSLKKPRCKHFELPKAFCVGRLLGHLPIGLVIYAARNQYNHFNEDRLSVVNEVIFNYLNIIFPEPRKTGISFNLYDGMRFYSYSVLCALGWVDSRKRPAYQAYISEMAEVLKVEL
jgi:hypothetical protein